MFLSEEEEQPFQIGCPQIPIKPVVIPTYATQSLAPYSLNIGQDSSFQKLLDSPKSSSDVSLEEQIFKGNAELVRTAVIEYLKKCLGQKFYETRRILPKTILCVNQILGFDEEESILELITSKNKLLSNETQIKIFNYIQLFPQITSLFKQIKPLLGNTLTQELAFILARILILKIEPFKQLRNCQCLDLIPQMERFWGDQGEQRFISNGWEIYEEIDYSSIKRFSVEKIEQIASKLYYAPQLEYLNLSQAQIGDQANSKFSALVCLFSQTLFLTMSGIRQEKQDLLEFLQELKLDMSSGEVQNEHPVKRTKLQ